MQGGAGGSEDGDEGWKDVREQGERLFASSSHPRHQYSLLFIMQITRNMFQWTAALHSRKAKCIHKSIAETNELSRKNNVRYSWKRSKLKDTAGLCSKRMLSIKSNSLNTLGYEHSTYDNNP